MTTLGAVEPTPEQYPYPKSMEDVKPGDRVLVFGRLQNYYDLDWYHGVVQSIMGSHTKGQWTTGEPIVAVVNMGSTIQTVGATRYLRVVGKGAA